MMHSHTVHWSCWSVLHFPMGAPKSSKEGTYHYDAASSPFKCYFGVLMWPQDSWKKWRVH